MVHDLCMKRALLGSFGVKQMLSVKLKFKQRVSQGGEVLRLGGDEKEGLGVLSLMTRVTVPANHGIRHSFRLQVAVVIITQREIPPNQRQLRYMCIIGCSSYRRKRLHCYETKNLDSVARVPSTQDKIDKQEPTKKNHRSLFTTYFIGE